MQKYYSVKIKGSGKTQVEELHGKISKTSGQPDGKRIQLTLKPGSTILPNTSKVWAEKQEEGNPKKYKGKLNFLPWGDPKGSVVQLRYIPGVPTLDKLYQDSELKMKFSEEEMNEISEIELESDINDFDIEQTDPMLLLMIKHHTYNGSNKSRNPQNRNIFYEEYNPADISRNRLDTFNKRKTATDYIHDAQDDPQKLYVLAKMFNLDPQQHDEVLFNSLLDVLGENEENYGNVLVTVENVQAKFKARLDELFGEGILEEGQSEEEKSVFEMHAGERKILIDDISPEVKDVKQYLVTNILEPEVFKAYERVLELASLALERYE